MKGVADYAAALRRRAEQQAAVARLGQLAVEDADLDRLFDEAARVLSTRLDVEFAKVLELRPGGEDLFLRAGVGWREGLVGTAIVPAGESQAGFALRSGVPVIVTDLPAESRFRGSPLLLEHGVRSGLSVILPGRRRPWGVLGAHARDRRHWKEDDIHFLQAVANVLAAAVERERAERRRDAEHAVSRILAAASNGDFPIGAVLQAAGDCFGWAVGEWWEPDEKGGGLALAVSWDDGGPSARLFVEASHRLSFRAGEGLPGRAWSRGEPVWMEELSAASGFRRADGANEAAFRSGLAFPVAAGEGAFGVLVFLSRDPLELDEDVVATLDAIGALLAHFLERRRVEAERVRLYAREREARAAAERAQRRSALLAEAGALVDASMDYRETLANVARLAVPDLADYCVVYLVEGGRVERVEVAHADPEKHDLLARLDVLLPPDLDDPDNLISRVLRTGDPVLVPRATEELMRAVAAGAPHLEILRAIAPVSGMIVPMAKGDRIVGALAFAAAKSGRRYTEDDLELARELGRRAALAVDNVRLYRAERRAREAAEAASQAKDRFLAVISHELRTPLNAILAYTELFRAEITGPLNDVQRQQAERIQACGRHLDHLINQLLAHARMEEGEEVVRLEEVDAAEVVREAGDAVEPLADRKGLSFSVDLPAAWPLATDPDKLRQILLNLLFNAVRYTDAGSVTVTMRRRDGVVEVDVRDTGVGIAAERLEEIFEPFAHGDRSVMRRQGGTGLGLSVSRRLARLLGGDIDVSSTLGEGTRFRVRLPDRGSVVLTDGETGSRQTDPDAL